MGLCDGSDEIVLGDGGLDEGVGERGGAAEDLSTLNGTVSGFSLPRRYSREKRLGLTTHTFCSKASGGVGSQLGGNRGLEER